VRWINFGAEIGPATKTRPVIVDVAGVVSGVGEVVVGGRAQHPASQSMPIAALMGRVNMVGVYRAAGGFVGFCACGDPGRRLSRGATCALSL
jgi:hypothetical protein